MVNRVCFLAPLFMPAVMYLLFHCLLVTFDILKKQRDFGRYLEKKNSVIFDDLRDRWRDSVES